MSASAINLDDMKLPSPSPEGIQVMEMLSEVNVDLNILSDVISRDPVLAATAMRYANSPIYRRIVEIDSVRKAVNMLGTKNVATIILIATMRGFSTPPSRASEAYWEHSLGVAALARLIARRVDRSLQDKVEFLATIHDIGAMTLSVNFDDYDELYLNTLASGQCIVMAENNHYGMTHDDVTPMALQKLQLPDDILPLLQNFHHRKPVTEIRSEDDKMLAILSLAHQLEKQVHGDTRVFSRMPESSELLISLLKLDDDEIDDIIDDFEDILSQGF